VAIVKACEAFAKGGLETTLIAPRRRNTFDKSVFESYNIPPTFEVCFLPTVDLIREKAGAFVFLLQALTFKISLLAFLLTKSRATLLYTREPDVLFLSTLGFKVAFECHLIPKNRERFFARVRKAHRIIVISQALKQAFVEAGFPADAILVAPSGVDLSIFDINLAKEDARRQLSLPATVQIALYTGNFTTMGHDKGIADIIQALADAPDVLFVAAGGAERDLAQYQSLADAAGVSNRVMLRGSTTQAMLAAYQKAADVLLMPFPDTPHYRNHMSPVKMFEYMAAKRPILASDLPTIREVLNETNAVIVPPGNPSALAVALKELFADTARAERLSAAAYEHVQHYSWTARTERVLAFLRAA
jgi:glycosyltransferase involved in cell wall biosynthesis